MTPAVEIGVAAAAVSLFSFLVNKKIGSAKKMKETQARINDFQKRYSEAKKAKDEALLKKLEEEQAEIMGLTKQLMVGSFKPMLFTLAPALAVFYFLGNAYGSIPVVATIPVFNWAVNWLGWYIFIAIVIAIALEIGYRWVYARKQKA